MSGRAVGLGVGDGSGHFVKCFVFWGEDLGGCGSDMSQSVSYDVEEVFEYMNRVGVGVGWLGKLLRGDRGGVNGAIVERSKTLSDARRCPLPPRPCPLSFRIGCYEKNRFAVA